MKPRFPMLKTAGHRKGFTLIEVMIASGLISLEILAVIAMFTTAAKTASYSRRLTTATSLAQTQIELAKNTAYANLDLLDDNPECFDVNLGTADCGGEHIYRRETLVSADTPDLGMSQVAVAVSWLDSKGRSHQTRLISAISKF